MNLAEAFGKATSVHPDKIAIYWGETTYSFSSLHAQALALGAHLQGVEKVQPGERVALWLKNCPEFVPALFGILASGAVVVPINNFLKPDEVAYILRDAGVRVIVSNLELNESRQKLAEILPHSRFWNVDDFSGLSPAADWVAPARVEDDLAVIIYTSGTTGHPKGAMLTHGNFLENVNSCRQVLEIHDDDRLVVLLPMFHSFMLCVCVLLPMTLGCSMVLIRSLNPPKNILTEILHGKATILPAVPQFFRTLLHPSIPAALPLRLCISGGAPLPVETLREFMAKFPMPLLEGYGLSEASPVVSFTPIKGPWKAGSIGKPIPNVEVSIQDDAGNILPPGETGELCVRGGNVMKGYLNQPEETRLALREGWLLTGDVGHEDTDGYFYITDRKKDMLLVNGINVYPREIEELIYHFPGVKEAAVVGFPDARRGEQPVAFVAMNDGATLDPEKLQHFLKEKLADYKVPRKILQLPALPRNPTGKILKTALRKMEH
jgi:long-chain acyl-CoA synthetase